MTLFYYDPKFMEHITEIIQRTLREFCRAFGIFIF